MCQKFLWGGFVHEMGFLKASEGPKYTQENKCRGDLNFFFLIEK
jgi:hypothetical protein